MIKEKKYFRPRALPDVFYTSIINEFVIHFIYYYDIIIKVAHFECMQTSNMKSQHKIQFLSVVFSLLPSYFICKVIKFDTTLFPDWIPMWSFIFEQMIRLMRLNTNGMKILLLKENSAMANGNFWCANCRKSVSFWMQINHNFAMFTVKMEIQSISSRYKEQIWHRASIVSRFSVFDFDDVNYCWLSILSAPYFITSIKMNFRFRTIAIQTEIHFIWILESI